MKAILNIPEKKIKLEFENLTYNQYRMIKSKPSNISPMIIEKYPVGKIITLITSEMPEDLKIKIENVITQYCNY